MFKLFTLVPLISLSSLTLVHAAPLSRSSSIDWFSCRQNGTGTVPYTCGTLAVPLDYTNASSGDMLTLSLVKVEATKEPKLGSILFNDGGPGLVSRTWLTDTYAEPMLVATGGQYDLIAFDPRGTGTTIPYTCYASEAERSISETLRPTTTNSSNAALGEAWAFGTAFAENCYDNAKNIGELVGTAFVARDMMKIVDALGEDVLNYWGFSYGTILGATVAAMFPDRMGRVVIDGVVNVHDYYAGRDAEQYTETDRVFNDFCQQCIEAPELCPLARNGTTAESICKDLYDLLETMKFRPIALGPDPSIDIVRWDWLKANILGSIKAPQNLYPTLAAWFDSILTRNRTAYQPLAAAFAGEGASPPTFPNYGSEAQFGIRCSDTTLRSNNLADVIPVINDLTNTSYISGDLQAAILTTQCAQWKFDAKERYCGNFSVKTKNPMLVVGSPNDPITPLVSARNVSAGFEGSAVLKHNGYGHCSLGQPSKCVVRAIADYFTNGTLPPPGKECKPDLPVFTNATLAIEEAFSL